MADNTQVQTMEPRTIEAVTAEILELKNTAGGAILAIGQRLTEAKAMLPEGEWQMWCEDKVDFSLRTAQRFMRLAREWSDATALSRLGASKALSLLALPPAERDAFIASAHTVDGEEKTVADMTSRELQRAIREREEALAAQKAAEDELDKVGDALMDMERRAKTAEEQLSTFRVQAETTTRLLDEKSRRILELESRPVEVAVQVDEEAVAKARTEGAAEAKKKLDSAEKARKKAEDAQKKAEAELAQVKAQLDASRQAEKKAAIEGDKDISTFGVCFNQAQSLANQMHGILLKARNRGDNAAANLQQAMLALADSIRKAAEG